MENGMGPTRIDALSQSLPVEGVSLGARKKTALNFGVDDNTRLRISNGGWVATCEGGSEGAMG